MKKLQERLFEEILKIPVVDIHTHIKPGRPQAENLYDLLSYHFVLADLEAVGFLRDYNIEPDVDTNVLQQ
ncbi:MAG: hypothetical protein GXO71_05160 [Caldiserica bacterium]|nr:hypothetical protein [Caldisericota bacterium]